MAGERRVLQKTKALGKPAGKGAANNDGLQEIIRGKDLYVLIKGAHGLKSADGPIDSSDPFCRMKVGEFVSFRTRTMFKTTQPEWNETKVVREADLIRQHLSGEKLMLEFGVYDYDVWTKHDKLGKAALDLNSLISDLQDNRHAVRSLPLSRKIKPLQQDSMTSASLSSSGSDKFDSAAPGAKGLSLKGAWKMFTGSTGSGSKESLGFLEVEVWLEDASTAPEKATPEGRVIQTVLQIPHATRASSRSICLEVPDCGTLYEEPFVVYYKVTLFAVLDLDYQFLSASCKNTSYLPSPKRDVMSLRSADSMEPPDLAREDSYAEEPEHGLNLLSMESQESDSLDSAPSGLYAWIKVVCKGHKYQTRLYSVPKSGQVTINQSFVFPDVRPVSKDPAVVFALYATTHKGTRGRNVANTDMPLSFMLNKVKKHPDFHDSKGAPFPVTFDVDFLPPYGSVQVSPMKAQLKLHVGVADHDLRPHIYGLSDILTGFDGQISSQGSAKVSHQAGSLQSQSSDATGLPSERLLQKFDSLPDNISREDGQGLEPRRTISSMEPRKTSDSGISNDMSVRASGDLDTALGIRQRKITRIVGADIDLDDVPEAIQQDNDDQHEGTRDSSLSSTTSDGRLLSRQAKLRPGAASGDKQGSEEEELQPPTFISWILGLLQLLVVYSKDAWNTFKAGSTTPIHKPPEAVGSISILVRSFEVLEGPCALAFQARRYHLAFKCGPHWWFTQPGRSTSGQVKWEVVLPLYDPACMLTVLLFESADPLGSSLNKVLNQREKVVTIIGRARLRLPELPINAPSDVVLDLRGLSKGKVECTGTVDMRLHVNAEVTSLLQAYIRPSKPHAYYMLGLFLNASIVTKYWEDTRQKDLLERTILTKKVMEAVVSTGRQKFTIQRIKAHVNRITQLLKTEEVAQAALDFHNRVLSWEEPAITGGAAVGIVLLCKFTTLIICAGVLGLVGWSVYMFTFDPPEPIRVDLELQTMSPAAEEMPSTKDENEDNREVPTSSSYKLLKERYEFGLSIMLQVQNVIDDVATAIEKFSMMMTWQDPRITTIMVITLVVGAPVVWLVGLSNLLILGMLWHIRPPSLRSPRPPPPVCLFDMLPAKADLRV